MIDLAPFALSTEPSAEASGGGDALDSKGYCRWCSDRGGGGWVPSFHTTAPDGTPFVEYDKADPTGPGRIDRDLLPPEITTRSGKLSRVRRSRMREKIRAETAQRRSAVYSIRRYRYTCDGQVFLDQSLPLLCHFDSRRRHRQLTITRPRRPTTVASRSRSTPQQVRRREDCG